MADDSKRSEVERKFKEDVVIARGDEDKKAIIHIFARETTSGSKDSEISLFLDGKIYTVKTGVDVEVPLALAKAALRSGDIDSYRTVNA